MQALASAQQDSQRSVSRPKPQRRFRADSGQNLIEFALMSLALVSLLLGVIDIGRFAYIGILVGNAARAGAAYGAANPGDDAGIENAACNDFLGNIAAPSNLGAKPAPTCSGASGSTNHLQVTWPGSQTEFVACGCDAAGAFTATYNGAACDTVPQSYIAGNCGSAGDHWASEVSVEASGSFRGLFLPKTVTFDQKATVRVPR